MASQFHERVRAAIREVFPAAVIREEVLIRWEGRPLFVDFYLPLLGLAFEVDGDQHDHYVAHFFPHWIDFRRAQKRDEWKEEWADHEAVKLIRIPWADRDRISGTYILARIQGVAHETQ